MIVGITGASGFLGTKLIQLATEAGHHIVGFSRNPSKPISGCSEVRLFSERPDVNGCDAIVHLAGESVFGLWTAQKKERIRRSRVEGTRHLVEAILAAEQPPKVLLGGSAIGFYGDTGESAVDESSAAGTGFLAEVAVQWESEAMAACQRGVRVALLRTSVVLGKGGGAMKLLAPLFKAGLGGPLGSGQQWFSWIHIEDWAALALFVLEQNAVSGPINAVAPAPVQNREFTKILARAVHRPAFFKAPAFALRALLGEFSCELLDSKRVLPKAALQAGFKFRYPSLPEALDASLP